jgi:radical SAM superfamily enzyme YgiQ (UPF0313 family)
VIGFGVYIWNIAPITQVIQTIKSVRPDVTVVIGGPEVSYEYEGTELFAAADYLIRGEGEVAFAHLAQAILEGRRPAEKVLSLPPPDLVQLTFPYDAYTEEDLAQRIVYVEASRGCPFTCDFCLSSLDNRVREFQLDAFLEAMSKLLARGARKFTFVDRTFNLRQDRAKPILEFFLQNWRDGMRLHLEILPDRLDGPLLDLLARFPPAGLHLEVGVQALNPEVMAGISRRQDIPRTIENLHHLRTKTGSVLHADLIVGLPGESWESFADGFDRLVALEPQEIQVGVLKRLKGAPIARHIPARAMAFSSHPPYEILQNDLLDFGQMQRLKRFARYFDLYYNSGNFPHTLPLLWRTHASAFAAFMKLTDSLWSATGRTHEFPLVYLAQHLYQFLVQADVDRPETLAAALKADLHRIPGRKDKLKFLSKPV